MPTLRQEKAFKEMVENGGKKGEAMVRVGYSVNTAKTPTKVTNSKGFQELCEAYGLTEELLVSSLVSDIKTKKKNRKAELELGFKIKGRLTERVDVTSAGKPFPLLGGKSNGTNNNSDKETSRSEKED